MNLGCRSQSMPWIFCFGIISTWWTGRGRRNKHKSDIMEDPPPAIPLSPLPPSTHTVQPAIINPFFLHPFCYSFGFCCSLASGLKTLCVFSIMYVCVCSRVCLKALWNDTLIQSVLYFLILLTITAWVKRRCSFVFFSGFLWLSKYHVVEWECFYKCCIAVRGEAFRVVCFFVPSNSTFFPFF